MPDTPRLTIAGVVGIGGRSSDLVSTVFYQMGMLVIDTPKLIGSLLETNLGKAVEMAVKQRKAAIDFSGTFPKKTVEKWRKMVKEWQENPSCSNPYVSNERGMYSEEIGGRTSDYYSPSIENLRGLIAASSRRGC